MSRLALSLAILLGAARAAAFTHWSDIRASANLSSGQVTIRTESAHIPGQTDTILRTTRSATSCSVAPTWTSRAAGSARTARASTRPCATRAAAFR